MAESIVARRDELLEIRRFVDAIPDGGHALLFAGDPGIGKTELWRAATTAAHAQGYLVLASASSSSEAQIAFTAIGDLFSPVVDDVLPVLPQMQREALESALLIREPSGAPLQARTLGVALVSAMQSLTGQCPVLVALDDAQWIDASSANVLNFLFRRLANLPVGLLATVRGRHLAALPDLDRSWAVLRSIDVMPLSIGAIHSLVLDRLGISLPRPLLIRIYETSGGNPFYALELARSMNAGSMEISGSTVPLPDSLLALVEKRLNSLPASAAPTLVSAAALATPSVTLLAPLGATVVADLELAARHDVIQFDGDRIRFTHPLLVPACYALLPLHRRRDIHRRLANLDVDPEERARHLALSAVGPDAEIADALESAADRAVRRGAAQAAAELADLAAELTPGELEIEIGRRRVAAAFLASEAGDLPKARMLLDHVVATARPGSLRAEGLSRLAAVRAQSEGNPVATDLLLQALDEPDIDLGQQSRILGMLAWNSVVGGESQSALSYAGSALDLAERWGDPGILVESLTTSADVTFWRYGSICRDLLKRAAALYELCGGPLSSDPRHVLAQQLGRADHFGEARQMWDALIADADARNDPEAANARFFLARMETAAGRWATALQLCDEAVSIAQQTGRENTEPLCQMVASEISMYRGTVDRDLVLSQVETAQRMGYGGAVHRLNRALASAELAVDNPAAAWSAVEALFDGVDEMDEVLGQLAGSVGIEALMGIGALTEAERLLQLLERRAATADTDLDALANRSRALLLHAAGDELTAIAALESAADIRFLPAERNPFEQARTLFLLGRIRRESNQKKAARDALESAAQIFESLGALRWHDRTRAEIRRIGGRNVSQGELSETERRIVDLVAAGYTNRAIANTLHLSPNTVAWNLTRVYKRFGVTTRTALVAHLSGISVE
jgi:DNA-binding CsgD family transcriptional regulator